MTYDTYRLIFIVAAILAGIMLVLSVVLFIKFKIPKAMGDVTGSTARKAVEEIRAQNRNTGDIANRPDSAGGKIPDKMMQYGQLHQQAASAAPVVEQIYPQGDEDSMVHTAKLRLQDAPAASETAVLPQEAAFETEMLSQPPAAEAPPPDFFRIEQDITYIHSNEIIVD